MPTLRFESSLAAGATDTNILAGSKFEILPFNSAVSVFAVQDGADAGDLKADFTLGNVIEIDDAAVPTFTPNQGPNRQDHLLGAGVARAHDRLQIKLVNGDAVNAANYRILVDIRAV